MAGAQVHLQSITGVHVYLVTCLVWAQQVRLSSSVCHPLSQPLHQTWGPGRCDSGTGVRGFGMGSADLKLRGGDRICSSLPPWDGIVRKPEQLSTSLGLARTRAWGANTARHLPHIFPHTDGISDKSYYRSPTESPPCINILIASHPSAAQRGLIGPHPPHSPTQGS